MSGLENAVAVYSVRADSSPPQPQVGARRAAADRAASAPAADDPDEEDRAERSPARRDRRTASGDAMPNPVHDMAASEGDPGSDARTPPSPRMTIAGKQAEHDASPASQTCGTSITARRLVRGARPTRSAAARGT